MKFTYDVKERFSNSNIERETNAFHASEDDFGDVEFPATLKINYSYSNHFDWFSYDSYKFLPLSVDVCESHHGGSGIQSYYVSNASQVAYILNGLINENYINHEYLWTEVKIETTKYSVMVRLYKSDDIEFFNKMSKVSLYEEMDIYEALKKCKSFRHICNDAMCPNYKDALQEQIDKINSQI